MATNKGYTEKDIATNLLVSLKHMKALVNIFSQEASNGPLFQTVDEVYQSISSIQRDVYDMMSAQGWYKMSADSKENINKAYTKFAKSKEELS